MSAYEYSYEESNRITKSIPDFIDGSGTTYEAIVEIATNNDDYQDLGPRALGQVNKAYETLQELFVKYPEVHSAVTELKGCIANTGLHAGGVVVSGKILKDNIPLVAGSETAVLPLVQVDMDDLEYYSALKIDALGLTTLTMIQKTMDLVGLDYDWYDSEDFSDTKIYEMLRNGETTDIFQMASFVATKMIQDMKVEDIEGLTIVNAGNRPGPLAKNEITGKSMVDLYIERKNSGIVPSIDERIDWILEPTLGTVWYQEQCMLLGQHMAGYTLGGADIRIRKVLAGKKVKMIDEIENEFIYGKKSIYDEDHHVIGISEEDSEHCTGAIAHGFTEEVAKEIFDIMKEFSKYAFNKSHSGCYSALAYKTAWLSCHYPVEWAVACLSTHDKTEKITATLGLCKKREIPILPPDINKSEEGFTVEILPDGTKAIRYGLLGIKGVGARAIEIMKQMRDVKKFTDFGEFYDRVHDKDLLEPFLYNPEKGKNDTNPINKRSESALIKAGAFDELEPNRYKLLNQYLVDIRKEKGTELLDEKDYARKEKLAFEKELMGSYISEHPLDPFPYSDISSADNGDIIETTGMVLKTSTKKTKRGDSYMRAVIETKDDKQTTCMMFSRTYTKYKERMKKGEIVVIVGEVNTQFNNININKVKKIVRQSALDMPAPEVEEEEELEDVEDNTFKPEVRPDPMAELFNPVDSLLQNYGGR